MVVWLHMVSNVNSNYWFMQCDMLSPTYFITDCLEDVFAGHLVSDCVTVLRWGNRDITPPLPRPWVMIAPLSRSTATPVVTPAPLLYLIHQEWRIRLVCKTLASWELIGQLWQGCQWVGQMWPPRLFFKHSIYPNVLLLHWFSHCDTLTSS